MSIHKLLLAAAAITVIFAACKKGDDGGQTTPPVTTYTRKDTLSSGKWYLTSANGTFTNPISGQDTTFDLFASFDICAKDDRYIFRTDGKVTNDQGVKKCDSTGPQQTDGGTWSLNVSKDTLTMSDGTLPGRFKILSFNSNSMQLRSDTSLIKLYATFAHE